MAGSGPSAPSRERNSATSASEASSPARSSRATTAQTFAATRTWKRRSRGTHSRTSANNSSARASSSSGAVGRSCIARRGLVVLLLLALGLELEARGRGVVVARRVDGAHREAVIPRLALCLDRRRERRAAGLERAAVDLALEAGVRLRGGERKAHRDLLLLRLDDLLGTAGDRGVGGRGIGAAGREVAVLGLVAEPVAVAIGLDDRLDEQLQRRHRVAGPRRAVREAPRKAVQRPPYHRACAGSRGPHQPLVPDVQPHAVARLDRDLAGELGGSRVRGPRRARPSSRERSY